MPPNVNVPLEVIAPPVSVRPVVPPAPDTLVTVPLAKLPIASNTACESTK